MMLFAGLRVACGVFALLIAAVIVFAAPAMAAPGECRHIQSRKDRNACYEQQKAAPKKRAAPTSHRDEMDDTVDRLKLENDRLNKRLQGICRGC
jgi:hypothetical protein